MKLFHWMLTTVKYTVLWDLWPHLALLQDCLQNMWRLHLRFPTRHVYSWQ